MPYLKIQTNLSASPQHRSTVLKKSAELISTELQKDPKFVMVALEPDTPMYFNGSEDPVAFLELKSIGLDGRQTKRLSEVLCALIEKELAVPSDRIYVKFIDVNRSMWGWRGDTFEGGPTNR